MTCKYQSGGHKRKEEENNQRWLNVHQSLNFWLTSFTSVMEKENDSTG